MQGEAGVKDGVRVELGGGLCVRRPSWGLGCLLCWHIQTRVSRLRRLHLLQILPERTGSISNLWTFTSIDPPTAELSHKQPPATLTSLQP